MLEQSDIGHLTNNKIGNSPVKTRVVEMQVPREVNRTEVSSPVIVEMYSEYVRCEERDTQPLSVLQSSVSGEEK